MGINQTFQVVYLYSKIRVLSVCVCVLYKLMFYVHFTFYPYLSSFPCDLAFVSTTEGFRKQPVEALDIEKVHTFSFYFFLPFLSLPGKRGLTD